MSNGKQNNTSITTLLFIVAILLIVSIVQSAIKYSFFPNLFGKKQESDTSFVWQELDKPVTVDSYNAISVEVADELSLDEKNSISVYQARNKAVVNITTEVLAYTWFYEPVPRESGVGSGTIIDKRGYVLTNYHVIENANKVFVTFWDKTKVEGEIVGLDVENDLTVLKVSSVPSSAGVIPLGDSNFLKIGQKVLAIGNPFGLDRTLTTGIVSGLNRPIRSSSNIVIQNMIQTDAAINKGNSGGPLLNARGELVGVNTLIYSPGEGSVGISFAVPASTARRVVPDLIRFGKVKRGWIEWQVQPLFRELVSYADLPVGSGLLVSSLDLGSNAQEAGLRGGNRRKRIQYGRSIVYLGGDIIIKIANTEVTSMSDLLESLENTKPGEKVEVEFYRDGKKQRTSIVLIERPTDLVIR